MSRLITLGESFVRQLVARFQSAFNAAFRRDAMRRAMDVEFAHHIEMRSRDLMRRGLSEADAAQQARTEFGNLTTTRQMTRESRGMTSFDSVGQDLHYATRTLRRNKGFTAVAVLSLGLGIGATTTMFSIVNSQDLRALPYANADRLVWLGEITPQTFAGCANCPWQTSPATASDWMAEAHSFESVAAFTETSFKWTHDNVEESLGGRTVTPQFLSTLGIRPALGRAFNDADAQTGAAPVAIVSYDFWRSRLSSNTSVIGTRLLTGTADADGPTIIGVLPQDFQFWHADDTPIWRPMNVSATASRTNRNLKVIARLKPHSSLASASVELRTITARLAAAYPVAYRDWGGASIETLRSLFIGPPKERYVLFGVTALVLCVAIVNVASLLLSRAIARQSEFAMRSALGASRARLVRQLLIEGASVGAAGGAAGMLLAYWATRFVPHWFGFDRSGLPISIDMRVLTFGILTSFAAGLAAAIIPAFRSSQFAPASAFRRSGMSSKQSVRISSVLISMQIAFALVLVTAASLLGRDFVNLRYLDIGYDPDFLYSTTLIGTAQQSHDLPAFEIATSSARLRVGALPGVSAVAIEHQSGAHPQVIKLDGVLDVSDSNAPVVKAVNQEYFAAFATPLVLGRLFNDRDQIGSEQVVIVNRAAARRYWPSTSAVGHLISVGEKESPQTTLRIVGVVEDAERGQMVERHWPMFYRPIEQAHVYHAAAGLYVRVPNATPAVFASIQNAIHEATGQTIAPLSSESASIARRLLSRRSIAVALNVFAMFGLLLASMGLYGSTSHAAAQRTREVGIRMALGAERGEILSLLAQRSVVLALSGIILGVLAAFASTRLLRSFVVGTSVTDPWMFVASTAVMIVVAFVATFVPARRATNVDPTVALRGE